MTSFSWVLLVKLGQFVHAIDKSRPARNLKRVTSRDFVNNGSVKKNGLGFPKYAINGLSFRQSLSVTSIYTTYTNLYYGDSKMS